MTKFSPTTRTTFDNRIHVTDPRDWASCAGTDFWLVCHGEDYVAAGGMDLANHGWLADGFGYLASDGAGDVNSLADVGTLGGFNFDVAEDTLLSPALFGDYTHVYMAEGILNKTLTKLSCEFSMYLAANADNESSGCGFWTGAATDPLTKATTQAVITSDGTDFSLESSAGADAGSTDNTTPHIFKVELTFGSTWEWFIDETSQGVLADVTDKYPLKFGAGTGNGGTIDPVLQWAHCYYS